MGELGERSAARRRAPTRGRVRVRRKTSGRLIALTIVTVTVGACTASEHTIALVTTTGPQPTTDVTQPTDSTSGAPSTPATTDAALTTNPVETTPVSAAPPTVGPAPTSAAPTTAAPSSSARLALDVLRTIPVELEHSSGYDRDLFVVWADLDGDGCNTRQEVLRTESLDLVQADPSGCPIIAGRWFSVYDGLTFEDPSELDIDHVVALKEAWDSGAWAWTSVQRIAFANDQSDPRTLVAVSASSNRSKGDRDPSNWLPTAEDPCRYIADWVAIKARWSLSMDQSEWGRVKNLLQGSCAGTTID